MAIEPLFSRHKIYTPLICFRGVYEKPFEKYRISDGNCT